MLISIFLIFSEFHRTLKKITRTHKLKHDILLKFTYKETKTNVYFYLPLLPTKYKQIINFYKHYIFVFANQTTYTSHLD